MIFRKQLIVSLENFFGLLLQKNEIHDKLFNCIKTMYWEFKAEVRAGAKLTDYINCTDGVKQGDICSPLLFSLFINELALEMIQKGDIVSN